MDGTLKLRYLGVVFDPGALQAVVSDPKWMDLLESMLTVIQVLGLMGAGHLVVSSGTVKYTPRAEMVQQC